MARLPQAIDLPAPNGATTQGAAVDFSSLERAFEGAGRQLEQYDQHRKAADDEVAGRELETVRGAYEGGAIERASAYDGRQPGFAAGELSAFDEMVAPVLAREDLDDGVRDSLTRQSRDLRVRVGSQAVATEARARGARSAADRDAAEQAQAYKAIMAFDAMFDGLEDARRAEWDGASPGLVEGLRGDFALAREQVLEGLPEPVAERVRTTLQSREVTLQATAMAQEDEARDAGVLRTVGDGVRLLGNRAARDPALLNRWEEEFAPIRAMLPAHLRAEAEREAKQDIFGRALETRIQSGEFEAVKGEIAAGRYDWMDPGVVERLGSAIETADAVRTVEDAQAEADLGAELDREADRILSGEAPDPSLASRAERIAGPDMAAKVRVDQAAALRVRPLLGRLRTMSPADMDAELLRLGEQSGDAVGAATLALAQVVVDKNRALRGGDPAAWTTTPFGPGDRIATEVRGRLAAFDSNPTPETAEAYARATWTAQAQAGVGQLQRRILPSESAKAWVDGLDADGAPASALPDLAQRLALFGPGFRPQVIRELGLAGLKPADLGALMHYSSNPARMAQFARARGQALTELVGEEARRTEIEAALNDALAPYNAALASGQGIEATREAARTTAYGLAARGVSARDAARAATAPMTDGWAFEGSWAIPTNRGVSEDRIRGNARVLFANLIGRRGENLYTPPSTRYTPEQSRRNYLDIVREHGRWRNLTDGSGVELVTPGADGRGWVRVRDAAGRDLVRTWRELETSRTP